MQKPLLRFFLPKLQTHCCERLVPKVSLNRAGNNFASDKNFWGWKSTLAGAFYPLLKVCLILSSREASDVRVVLVLMAFSPSPVSRSQLKIKLSISMENCGRVLVYAQTKRNRFSPAKFANFTEGKCVLLCLNSKLPKKKTQP